MWNEGAGRSGLVRGGQGTSPGDFHMFLLEASRLARTEAVDIIPQETAVCFVCFSLNGNLFFRY